jgi:hypothetical protein
MNHVVTCREQSNDSQQRVSNCDARSYCGTLLVQNFRRTHLQISSCQTPAELLLQNSLTALLADLYELADRAVIK